MTEPYQNNYQDPYNYDQQGYYDDNGQWHYYQSESYDQSYQDQTYTDPNYPNYSNVQQQQPPTQPYNQQFASAPSNYGTQSSTTDWNQANQYPAPSVSQDTKKKSSINPRQIPRHVRHAANDTATDNRTMSVYYTSSDAHPPSPLDDCRIIDDGNASSRFIRLTAYQVPASSDMVDATRLSVGAIITPLALPGPGEYAVPVVDMGDTGPIRCTRCQAYLNSFCTFTDDGHNFICNFCDMSSPIPHWYICNVDGNGQRRDRNERPELHLGSVEYVAPAAYLSRPIEDPCYLFVVDVSYAAVATGLLESSIRSINSCINLMAEYPRCRIGIITYNDTVHLYEQKKLASAPSVLVVASHDDVFLPLPADHIFMRPSDATDRQSLESILSKIPTLHESNRATAISFGAAVHVAVEALSSTGGKLLIFQSGLPKAHLGALDDRDNPSLYSTPKEKDLFTPQDSFYQLEATRCAERCISVDLFVCSNSYADMSTVGVLSTATGGQIFYYPDFHHIKDAYSLESDVIQTVSRETGFDAIMAVRTSAGLKVADTYGNFFRRHPTEIELPAIDADKAFAVRLEHESSVPDKSFIYIQAAMLYTTFNGDRRIRVHTVRALATTSLANVFRHADLYSVVNLSMRQAAQQCIEQGPAVTRTSLRQAVIDVLYTYRKECASVSSSGQLILPESLKLLPLYTLGLMKSNILHECIRADQRVYALISAQSMPLSQALAFCLPNLYAIHTLAENDLCIMTEDPTEFPLQLPEYELVSFEFIEPTGIYVLDAGFNIFLYVGPQANPQLVLDILGVEDASLYDANELTLYPNDNPSSLATRTYNLIERLRYGRSCYCPIRIVHARSPYMAEFKENLVEGTMLPPAGSKMTDTDPELMSYVDFLCFVHRRIQDKFV